MTDDVSAAVRKLTREELLHLIFEHGLLFMIKPGDIRWTRYEVLSKKAERICQEAIKEMKAHRKNLKKWGTASDKFARGNAMWDRAMKMIEAGKPQSGAAHDR